jgi:hypothetical protein
MTNKKVEMKIGRYITQIGKNDLILDNGASVRVMTRGHFDGWHSVPLTVSKKLFKDLKTCAFIFVDEEKTKQANAGYESPWLTYYRFDIDRMVKMGYEVVEDDR